MREEKYTILTALLIHTYGSSAGMDPSFIKVKNEKMKNQNMKYRVEENFVENLFLNATKK